jgi:hypothetical protein
MLREGLIFSLVTTFVCGNIGGQGNKQDTRKCCLLSEVYVEEGPGEAGRICTSVEKIGHSNLTPMQWRGKKLQDFAIFHGKPVCAEGEDLIPLYHHHSYERSDNLELLLNGTLIYTSEDHEPIEFSDDKYCVDKLFVSHNYSHIYEGDIANFAYVCMDIRKTVSEIVETLVYPVGVAVSMGCLTLTFLLYSFLPQLRDLTGKFILGICAFLTANYALRLVDVNIFGFKDPNVEELAIELFQHSCSVGAWLCLNSMGHHVWKVIQSKSVFTRVTDGQRCCYYSMYVTITTSSIACLAIAVHFLIGKQEGFGRYKVGPIALAIFYFPVVFILLVNVFFYWTSTKQIGKQLVYNRSMQHFQVNFDLFTKLFMVIGACWLFQTLALLDVNALDYIGKIFTLIQGPLIFIVAMCRTRVIFLFKKYFCGDACCLSCCRGNNEFIELPATELATIDKLKMQEEKTDDGANQSLLDKWGDANPVAREMSKSLFNVRSKPGDEIAPETPLMKVGRLLKANSLATLNFGWRRETSV